jgi:hypothetical protein
VLVVQTNQSIWSGSFSNLFWYVSNNHRLVHERKCVTMFRAFSRNLHVYWPVLLKRISDSRYRLERMDLPLSINFSIGSSICCLDIDMLLYVINWWAQFFSNSSTYNLNLCCESIFLHFIFHDTGAIGIALGFFTRSSCLLFTVPYAYIFMLDTCQWTNHYYLYIMIGVMLAVSDCGEVWYVSIYEFLGLKILAWLTMCFL